jgi:hypothetical protein
MRRSVKFVIIGFLFVFFLGCTNHVEKEAVDCEVNKPEVSVEAKTDPSNCDSNDGSITVAGTGGEAPYQFSINGGTYQSSGIFASLGGGTFLITIRDANGCENLVEATLVIKSSDLAATYESTEDTECLTDNGTITILPTGTNSPFEFSIGSGSFGSSAEFSDLKNGTYIVRIRDSEGCAISLNATVARGETGTSWSSEVKSIIDTNCAISGCHVSGQSIPNWADLSTVQKSASDIKRRTGNRSMPPAGQPALSQSDIDKIACWVDDGAKNN